MHHSMNSYGSCVKHSSKQCLRHSHVHPPFLKDPQDAIEIIINTSALSAQFSMLNSLPNVLYFFPRVMYAYA